MTTERLLALESVISALLKERFTEAVINNVVVMSGVDSDGDNILKITVVFESDKALDRKKLVGFVRHLRSKLEDEKTAEFPLVSFVSKSDVHKRKLEAA